MESTLAAVFSAALMFAGPGDARVAAPEAKTLTMVSAQISCHVWYEECYYCGEPGFWTCDIRCTLCEDWTEPICEPTGWICDPRERDGVAALFGPPPPERRLSCS
jgi:hypothetical protein